MKVDYDTPPEELTQAQIKKELDKLIYHTMYTANMLWGINASIRDEKRIEKLKDAYYIEYEHDPDTCIECAKEEQIMREYFDVYD